MPRHGIEGGGQNGDPAQHRHPKSHDESRPHSGAEEERAKPVAQNDGPAPGAHLFGCAGHVVVFRFSCAQQSHRCFRRSARWSRSTTAWLWSRSFAAKRSVTSPLRHQLRQRRSPSAAGPDPWRRSVIRCRSARGAWRRAPPVGRSGERSRPARLRARRAETRARTGRANSIRSAARADSAHGRTQP